MIVRNTSFFALFRQPWCSIYKKKAALLQLETDTHSFPQYRWVHVVCPLRWLSVLCVPRSVFRTLCSVTVIVILAKHCKACNVGRLILVCSDEAQTNSTAVNLPIWASSTKQPRSQDPENEVGWEAFPPPWFPLISDWLNKALCNLQSRVKTKYSYFVFSFSG